MASLNPKSLPLSSAYAFAAEHGLGAEATQIRDMAIDGPGKPATIRHGYMMKLFEDHGLFDQFMNQYWTYGKTSEGQAKRRTYSRVREEHECLMVGEEARENTVLGPANRSGASAEQVAGYGQGSNPQAEPKIRIALDRKFLEKAPEKLSTNEDGAKYPDEAWAEISRRRNAIEKTLRTLVNQGLRFSRGRTAGEAVLASVPEKRRSLLSQYGFPGVLDELYFAELANLILKNWDAFEKFFGVEKGKIEQWLDHINRNRADAHAKSLSDEDLAFLRVCFKRLEEILKLG